MNQLCWSTVMLINFDFDQPFGWGVMEGLATEAG
jgi:hypothetical protein